MGYATAVSGRQNRPIEPMGWQSGRFLGQVPVNGQYLPDILAKIGSFRTNPWIIGSATVIDGCQPRHVTWPARRILEVEGISPVLPACRPVSEATLGRLHGPPAALHPSTRRRSQVPSGSRNVTPTGSGFSTSGMRDSSLLPSVWSTTQFTTFVKRPASRAAFNCSGMLSSLIMTERRHVEMGSSERLRHLISLTSGCPPVIA